MIEKDVSELVNILRTTKMEQHALQIGMPIFLVKYLEGELNEQATLSTIVEEGNYGEQLRHSFEEIGKRYPTFENLMIDWNRFDQSLEMIYQFIDYVERLTYTKKQWITFLGEYILRVSHLLHLRYEEMFDVTPASINELVISLLKPKGTFYDGSLGIGTTAAAAYRYNENLSVYGQELNTTMTALAKIYLFMQGIEQAYIENGDTLRNPMFIENGTLKTFDTVVMNFPFTMQLPSLDFIEQDPHNRFTYGKLSRKSADYAFILHGLASLNDNGKAAMIVPSGVLFRGGMEEKVRAQLIADDVIEAVITLPENLFHYTSIQTNILIFNKNKRPELKNHIYFMNVENLYQMDRKQVIIGENDIEVIGGAYEHLKEESGFSKLVSTDDLEGANLLCQKYVFDPVIEDPLFGETEILMDSFLQKADTVKLKQVAEMYRGLNMTTSTFEEGNGPFKAIKLSDVQNGRIEVDTLTNGKLLRESRIERYLVEEGDLIISNRGATIKIAVIPKTSDRILLSHNFIGIRMKEHVNPHYVKQYLESPLGQFLLHQIQNGTAVLTINAKDLEAIDIVLPTIEEQSEIAEKFAEMEAEYEARLKELKQFKRAQTSLLYDAMKISEFMK